MKNCPRCESAIPEAAVRCPQCGHILTDVAPPVEAGDTKFQAIKVPVEETSFPEVDAVPELGPDEIALMIAGNPHLVRLTVMQPITFGRNFPKDSIFEMQLDLAALDAHNLGMSRRHARIEKVDDHFFLTDLGSSNGTLLNDERLMPNKPYLLLNGARIQLGRLKMLLFLADPEHDK